MLLFQAQIIWPVRRFWGQIYAQADEHKEDIYADNQAALSPKLIGIHLSYSPPLTGCECIIVSRVFVGKGAIKLVNAD